MSWVQIKRAVNSLLGTKYFRPLDEIINSTAKTSYFRPLDEIINKSLVVSDNIYDTAVIADVVSCQIREDASGVQSQIPYGYQFFCDGRVKMAFYFPLADALNESYGGYCQAIGVYANIQHDDGTSNRLPLASLTPMTSSGRWVACSTASVEVEVKKGDKVFFEFVQPANSTYSYSVGGFDLTLSIYADEANAKLCKKVIESEE